MATGSVKLSDAACICCGEQRGYAYNGPIYGKGSAELRGQICPWCISTGKAASRYNCFFSGEHPLSQAKIPRQIIIEVTCRTPGYSGWQQESWRSCCGDACAFYGDASQAELSALTGAPLARLHAEWRSLARNWEKFLSVYVPGGGFAIYRFQCLHCGQSVYAPDPS